jgi:hypothetical protein
MPVTLCLSFNIVCKLVIKKSNYPFLFHSSFITQTMLKYAIIQIINL